MSLRLHALELARLQGALNSEKYTAGSTHGFYLYPARFSPEIAHAVMETFSDPGDRVLDPFMGGGTAIIEGLAIGRQMIGIDLNALAHFVATVRTRPLSSRDEELILAWSKRAARKAQQAPIIQLSKIRNLPRRVDAFVSEALTQTEQLPFPRQQAFARSALLRLGQWALDCRENPGPSRQKLAEKLPDLVDHMLTGLRAFVESCQGAGVRKNDIARRRLLLCRDARNLHQESHLRSLRVRPRLVFTSPPYPCVHVLYHRWQVRGRKETPAPYWIAQVPDGYDASYYTGGSRTLTGERNYFSMIKSVFSSIRKTLDPDGLVVQLVGFADVSTQLPTYLATMDEAGFDQCNLADADERCLWRRVPNRKWHAKLHGAVDASSELLLFHRPRRSHKS